jgi:hypothetical protein
MQHPLTCPRRLCALALAAAAVLLLAAAAPRAGAAADTRGFPRTYHVYSGWSNVKQLARYDMLVGFANWNLDRLRARNPRGIFLLQPGLRPGGSDYGGVHITSGALHLWRGGTDGLPGPKLGYIRPFEAYWDYLWNANGSRAGRYPTWNYADPTGRGTPELVAKVLAYAAKASGLYAAGWDGVHTDEWNYAFVGNYGSQLDANRDGRTDDIGVTRRAWQEGMARAGRLLGSYFPGKIVGGNGSWWRMPEKWDGADRNAWRSSSNYTLVEHWDKHFYDDPEDAIATAREWLDFPDPLGRPRYLAVMQRALRCDGSVLEVPRASANDVRHMRDPCVMKSMRWGLTLALMAGAYYEIYAWPHHGTRWWYDEYDGGAGIRRRGYLGRPLGPATRLASGVYRRDFRRGVALNNSTSGKRTVQLGGAFRKLRGPQNPSLNNGRVVRKVTIPAHDGIILLRR